MNALWSLVFVRRDLWTSLKKRNIPFSSFRITPKKKIMWLDAEFQAVRYWDLGFDLA